MQIIYLDISNKGVVPTVYAKQGDVGRKFEVVLTDFGVPYYPPNGSAFSVWYSGSSGDGNYTDIGDKSAFFVSENKITVEMIAQMLSVDGAGILCLTLNSPDGSQISSWNIPYICEPVPGIDSEEAKSYYTAFSNAVKDLPYPDASLSTPGKAADAAATGMALNGKAPAGYGLGKTTYLDPNTPNIQRAEDLDVATKCGWCAFAPVESGGAATLNNISILHGILFVSSYAEGRLCQELYVPQQNAKLIRWNHNGSWSPWECGNPPMALGVEYRTTERWNGKAVYTKLVNYGGAPNNNTYAISHGASATHMLRCLGTVVSTGENFPSPTISVFANKTHISITTTVASPGQAYVQIWFTKD